MTKIVKKTKEECINECIKKYEETYQKAYEEEQSKHKKTSKSNGASGYSDNIKNKARMTAQNSAKIETFCFGLKTIEKESPNDFSTIDIKKAIEKAHVKIELERDYTWGKKASLDYDLVYKVYSAFQSHKKSSGNAFEGIIERILSESDKLRENGIITVSPGRLRDMLDNKEIESEEKVREGIINHLKEDNFDLYGLVKTKGKKKYRIFEVIETKTSGKDRIDRVRNFTKDTMNNLYLFSVCIILDGKTLNGKGAGAINGGTKTYEDPGCNAAYTLDGKSYNGRIYDISKISEHTIAAAKVFNDNRLGLNSEWTPEI